MNCIGCSGAGHEFHQDSIITNLLIKELCHLVILAPLLGLAISQNMGCPISVYPNL
jgi:hypothetical protein